MRVNLPFGLGFEIRREATGKAAKDAPAVNGADYLSRLVSVTREDQAMQIAAVYRCVSLISDSIAVMPIRYKRWNKAKKCYVRWDEHDLNYFEYLLNVRPNWRMNGFMLKKMIAMQILLKGNAVVVPVKNSAGFVQELFLVSPGAVISYNEYYNTYQISDPYNPWINGKYEARDVWHFMNPSCLADSGCWGESVISHAIRTLSTAATAETETQKNFATGGRFKMLLTGVGDKASFGQYDTEEMYKYAEDVEKLIQGHDVTALPYSGIETKMLSMSASDAAFLESRKFALQDIARWFGVPLYKLQEGNSGNYKTPEVAQVSFYNEALQPICSQIENELQCKTTSRADWDLTKFDFDEEPLFTLDIETKYKAMEAKMRLGLATSNELRISADIEPVEGGDELLVSANLKSMSSLKNDGGVAPQNTD